MKKLLIILSLIFIVSCGRTVTIHIKYCGAWTGTIVKNNTAKSINGYGDTIINLGDYHDYLGVMIQKNDKSINNLTVYYNCESKNLFDVAGINAKESTINPYGIVQLYYDYDY